MECLLPYFCMVAVPHIMVGLERMLDYRGVGLERFHCIHESTYSFHLFLFPFGAVVFLSFLTDSTKR